MPVLIGHRQVTTYCAPYWRQCWLIRGSGWVSVRSRIQTAIPSLHQSSYMDPSDVEGFDWESIPSTLRAPLSGTFLQTLPDLVTPLKGHSLSPRSCPPTRSAPSERFGYWYDCGSNLAPKHARKHEAHPPMFKKKKKEKREEFRLDSNDFDFIWAGVSNMVSYKTNIWYNLSCL